MISSRPERLGQAKVRRDQPTVTQSEVVTDGSSDERATVTDSSMTRAERVSLQILVEFLVWLFAPRQSAHRV